MVTGVILFSLSGPITLLFKMTPDTRNICAAMLRICACAMFLKAFSTAAIVGTMRSGGDTVFCMICDVGGVWLIGVPLVCVTGLVLGLPAPVVLGASYVEELFKCAAVIIRQRRGTWLKDLVNT